MTWRFGDHRKFQRAAAVVVTGGGVAGLVSWAAALQAPGLWGATGVGLAAAVSVLRGRGTPPASANTRRGRRVAVALAGLLAITVASAGALLAGAVWWALAPPMGLLLPPVAEAAVLGLAGGLVACLAVAAAHVERASAASPLADAVRQARASLAGEERALGERAIAAQGRIGAGLGAAAAPEARRLRRTSEEVALQVLGLAARCRGLRNELDGIDRDAVRARAAGLAEAAARSADAAARGDLERAARAVVALDERAAALDVVATRVRARLELQVALLEATAFAVAAREASVAADEAAQTLGPLADRLHEAGGDLDAQAEALAEIGQAG